MTTSPEPSKPPGARRRRELLRCAFDPVTMAAAVDQCLEWCAGSRAPHTVVTVNAAILCLIRSDPELREACRRGDLVVPDGVPVVWTSRLAGEPLPERVAGADLMVRLLEAGSRHRLRVYLLGARREVLDELLRRLARDYPGLTVAGARDGYFGPDDHPRVVAEVREALPHMLFVGMPSPFKETWCERHRKDLDVPVIMGVGGTFDVLAGYVRRAPRLMQTMGLEWSWRLAMEPRKMWKRYLITNTTYLWLAAREIVRRRLGNAR
jgi:N-acetylglucosaminyldiphosphoundecaprenol N-acetyl-beta-D-mannosaminyltransferase